MTALGSTREDQAALLIEGLSKTFGGLRAVEDVSLSVPAGQIHGLIGPNGSGKTTTFNLVSGVIKPDAGRVRLSGHEVVGAPPHRLVKLGMARTFQQIRLFPQMTAVENVMAALATHVQLKRGARLALLPAAFRAVRSAEREARGLLDRVGVTNQNAVAARLGSLDRHLTEIARALALKPRVLLLDEPMTGMVAAEAAVLEQLILEVSQDGVAVVLVEHHMELVMTICHQITVLNFGRVIASGSPAEVTADQAVIEAYLGRKRT